MALSRRQLIIQSFISLAGMGALSGCSCRKTMRVGIHPWIGYEPVFLAEDLGFLSKDISLVKGHNASQSIQRLKDNQVDAAALTLDEVLRVRNMGIPVTVVLVFDSSAGADMLLARSDISELSQLKGKQIGYEASALGELMMLKILQQAGLTEQDVTRINLPPDQQVTAWKSHEVDAVITYEPTASILRSDGGEVLFDSRQIPETIFDVLAVKTEFLQRCATPVRELVKADFRALNHMNTNFGDSLYRIANHENIMPDDVKSALRGVVLPSLAINRVYLSGSSSFYHAAQTLNALMYKKGMLTRPDDFSNLFSPRYLPEGSL